VRVEGYHYAIVSIGFSLTALSTANAMLGGIDERRREIGILKAVGWRSKSVAGLFMTEGILLGIAGGALGTLLGSSVFLYFYGYGSLSPASALAILLSVSVPGIVGALAAFYPARVAARVPPAEVVRYE
jgi:putative ABC transport system permease protein